MDVVALLRSKNRCLEKFLLLSTDFWKSAENGDISGLQQFQMQREATIRAFQLYDRKIAEAVGEMSSTERTSGLVEAVERALERKEEIIKKILEIDLKIIGKIEAEKNSLLQDLASSRKSKATIGKFKSGWVPESGEGLDEKL